MKKMENKEHLEKLEKVALKLVAYHLKKRTFNTAEYIGVLIDVDGLYDVLRLSNKNLEGKELYHVLCYIKIDNEKESYLIIQ